MRPQDFIRSITPGELQPPREFLLTCSSELMPVLLWYS